MSKYDDLDRAILRELASGRKTFTELQTGEVYQRARIAVQARSGNPVWQYSLATQLLDRRLQALRKKGQIQFYRGPGASWGLPS